MNEKVNVENCYFVKTVLMIFVVIYHSCVFWGGGWIEGQTIQMESSVIASFAGWISSFHVYGFTLVSGYLYGYMIYEKGKYKRYSEFVQIKLRRLIVPYWFVALCWVMPISSFVNSYSISEIIKRYILCTNPNQLWFLWMLFDVFMIIWPLSKVLQKKNIWLPICILSWIIGFVGNKYLPNIFCLWTAFSYMPYFIIGMKLRERQVLLIYKIPSAVYFVLQLLLYFGWRVLAHQENALCVCLTQIMAIFVYTMGALMSFVVLQRIACKAKWKENKAFLFLSKRTMPIYLFHQQIIYFSILWLNGKINPYINASVNFILAVVVSLLISCILVSNKYTRFLIGEK